MEPAPIRDVHLLVVEGDADENVTPISNVLDGETGGGLVGTVTAVSSVDGALEELSDRTADYAVTAFDRSVGCVVAAHHIEDGSGLELLETIRDRRPCVPVVFAPAAGDELLASESVAAGVAAYVPADRRADDLEGAVERAIEDGRERHLCRSRARGFSALFDDPETYWWLLDPDGVVERANEAVHETLRVDPGDLRGRSFERIPWWEDGRERRGTITDAVEAAAGGDVVRRDLRRSTPDRDDSGILEVTIRPVRDESGAVVSLLARAVDGTDRARLEAELRDSEELHRVTLNNMTDTVLVTDDDGGFTYVCPNVHFIFGYDDDEIREMETIDELLEPALFDPDELAAAGVLTNIECTATDKAGREHTLLVNVRQVSIQDGTTLYSCRDITKRKRREEALTALHRSTRELLYAETDQEIASLVVEDATDVLDLDASAAYLFDTDENVLRPAARSPGMASLHGPLSTHHTGDGTVPSEVFVAGESRFLGTAGSPMEGDPTSDVRSAAFVPLGDHGVFVAGSANAEEFDELSRELTDLLAATAEAALDRVERDRTLRERDRELKRRNRQLSRLNRINELIREIDGALVRAETRAEIERAVCERLTTADRFSFAWIGTIDTATERLEPRAHGGTSRGKEYLDSVSLSIASQDDLRSGSEISAAGREPAVRSAIGGGVTSVGNVADGLRADRWRREALAREYQSALAVSLSYDEFTYGVLTVYADRPDAFGEVTRAVFEELGETIASAVAAVERKTALLSSSRTRLEFDVADESFVFSRLAERSGCTISFDGGVRQHEGGATVFATVEGAPVSTVVDAARELVAVEDAQIVSGGRPDAAGEGTTTGGGTVRLLLSPPFLALRLADHGIVLQRVDATPSSTRVVVDVPSAVDDRGSADLVSRCFSNADLRSKQSVDRATSQDVRSKVIERLTDRQLEVVQLAYYSGYFESPRGCSGEDVAEALEISPAAFYRHVRTVERKLLELLFEEIGVEATIASRVE
ncbi:PAS domain S-box protein [Natrarchaeobius halalkaliphilus]|uniref:PAS domain S-box protein n=1 Tax=Natrarchaeobius halalkaliphilus TaxID=1679091 RepID=A0A3N6M999_9EURY|nr:bacterio-opsin activator domain-containing protein [Natrarchaeobius halalkaliphilus]RQG90086.1 PAS domain S-box protein [Natrarchaeobius halalkaliphilus]